MTTTTEARAPLPTARETPRAQRHIITPEYPPESGGVSDYVVQLAETLAAEGEDVHVWGPAIPHAIASAPESSPSLHIHRDLGRMTPEDLRALGEKLDGFAAPRHILLQWVPHGFRYRSMNLGFCAWLWKRARRGDKVEIMVHEAFLRFEGSWRQYAAAAVHRLMTVILLRSADRVWVSIPRYAKMWRPYTLGRSIPFGWLPLPSNVPLVRDPRAIAELHGKYTEPGGLLIGHFGTFGNKLLNGLLEQIIARVLEENSSASVILIGPGALFLESFLAKHPELGGRISSTGSIAATDPALSCHISACDLLIQPYPDGASTRRTSLMAPLQHGKAVVTTSGPATEEIWSDSRAVAITPTENLAAYIQAVNDLCADAGQRTALARAAQQLFESKFDIRHAVAALRESSSLGVPCAS